MKFSAQKIKGFTFLRRSFLSSAKSSSGFTLIELVLVISLLSAVLVISTVTLLRPVSSTSVESTANGIVSGLRDSQDRAINSDTGDDSLSENWGVHFETGSYTLFKGSSYSSSDSNNFTIELPQSIALTPNLPCSSPPTDCNNVVFQTISGEVMNFSSVSNSICVKAQTSEEQLITFNELGVVNVQNSC